jgi:hypothetical protein
MRLSRHHHSETIMTSHRKMLHDPMSYKPTASELKELTKDSGQGHLAALPKQASHLNSAGQRERIAAPAAQAATPAATPHRPAPLPGLDHVTISAHKRR